MKKKFLPLLAIALFLYSCSMPETVVRTTDTRPQIAIKNAPRGAHLYVDGLEIGRANKFDGAPKTLIIEPGTHLIVIKKPNGEILYKQKIFVESELKTISIK